MAYTVYNNNGTVLVNIANGEVDDLATSLDLIGKNVNNYGEIINNNFVRLLTNFSNSTGPRSPQSGQLWFDSQNNTLKVWNGSNWSSLLNATVGTTQPSNARSGELWYDLVNNQFKVFANGKYNLVGPNVNPALGKFGVEPTTSTYAVRDYPSGTDKLCSLIYSYGRPFMILSTSTFYADPTTSLYYYGTNTTATIVYSGTNILSTLSVNKDLIVGGTLRVSGGIVQTPDKTLTASYNSGWIGAFTTTYTATNNIIRLEILPYLFSIEGNTWTSATSVLSEVKVLLTSGTFTATEVRHYRLEDSFGVKAWQAYEVYPATGTSYFNIVNTFTNVVRIT